MKHDTLAWWPSSRIRFIIVDDHEMVRVGLRHMLEAESELELVGEAATGREALDLCRSLRPDLVLMDVQMPEMDGLEATCAIKQECPATSIVIVTVHEDPSYLLAALKAGASGYVLKGVSRAELIATMRQALDGEVMLNGDLATRALQQLSREAQPHPEPPLEHLTPRERDVLRLLAQGQTNREIAHNLLLSAGTVKIYVEHIIAKLGASDRTHTAVRAFEHGLLDAEDDE